MIKRAALAMVGFLALCFPLAAQETAHLEQTEDGTLTLEQSPRTHAVNGDSTFTLSGTETLRIADSATLLRGLPLGDLLDSRFLPVSSELAQMQMAPVDIFPVAFVSAVIPQKSDASPASGKDSPREVTPSRLTPEFISGEVGVFYGHSTGKFGGDAMGSYIESTFGTDKYQISVGASYEEFDGGRVPRWAR